MHGTDGFHYVLSKAQEEDIRECFLAEKLRNYTQVRLSPVAAVFQFWPALDNGRFRECVLLYTHLTYETFSFATFHHRNSRKNTFSARE